jgi:serine/threonine protein kinase
MLGGKKFGSGVKGETLDIACKFNNSDTLCKKLNNNISNINVITSDNKTHSIDEIEPFLSFLSTLNQYVIKIFKPHKKLLSVLFNKEDQNYKKEINGIKKIFKIYKNDLEKYTTIKTVLYNNLSIIGIQIIFKNKPTLYGTFSTKCNYEVSDYKFKNTKEFDIFIKQTLESIVIIQENNYAHTDLKPSNIIYCANNKTFKIIDWELLKKILWTKNKQYFANKSHNTPLTQYIYGIPVYAALKVFKIMNYEKYNEWYSSNEFQEIYNKVKQDLSTITKTKHQLFREYKYTFDIFAIGMTYGQLLIKNKLNFGKYKEFIYKLTDFKDGFKTAKEALDYFNQFLST